MIYIVKRNQLRIYMVLVVIDAAEAIVPLRKARQLTKQDT